MSDYISDYLEKLDRRCVAEPSSAPELSYPDVVDPLFNVVDPLFNDGKATYELKREKPEHRLLIFLKAQGLSDREISARTGFTVVMIAYVLKQPWARHRLLQEIQTIGRDQLSEVLKSSMVDSVFTLIEVRDSEKSKPSDRVAASNSLLDRYLGKPVARVEAVTTNLTTKLEDIAKMQKELAQVEQELARVTGVAKN